MKLHIHDSTQHERRTGWLPFLTLALVCLVGQAANANPNELPRTFTTIPAPPSDVAGETDGEDVTLRAHDVPARVPSDKPYPKLKALSYSREVKFGREEIVLKLQSPGKRRSFMMVELNF